MAPVANIGSASGILDVLPYWLLLGAFAGVSVAVNQRRPRSKPLGLLLWVGFVAMALMIGLRDHVGVDWLNYLVIWNVAGSASLERLTTLYGGDFGFYTLTWALQRLGAEFWVLNLICATVFAWGLVRFANLQPAPWVGITAATPYLVIVIAMSTTRQATAIGFVFLALTAFTLRKPRWFLIWMAAATLFHNSAILMVPLAGLSLARNRFESALLIIVLVVVGYFTLGSTFEGYSQTYIEQSSIQSSGTTVRLAMNGLAVLLFFLFHRRMPLSAQERILWRNVCLLAVGSVVLFFIIPSTTAVDRLLLYVFPLQVFVFAWLPTLIGRTAPQRTFVALGVAAYAALQLFVFLTFAVNREGFIPYRNYLF